MLDVSNPFSPALGARPGVHPARPEVVKEAVMMLGYRLVRLMEAHSEELAAALLARVPGSERCPAYRRVPADDLKQCVGEVYFRLGEWLLGKRELDIEQHYHAIGGRRALQGVPVSQVIWGIAVMKENLMEFLQRQGRVLTAGELLGELEVLQLIEQFFDRAAYYAALGHEEMLALQAQEPAAPRTMAAAGKD